MNRDLLSQLSQMQERLAKAQEDIESRVATGTAGGGAVTVEITGAYRVQSLKIDPEVIDPDDVGMLEDLVLAAVNEALQQVQGFHAENLGSLTGGLNIPGLPPGLGSAPQPGGEAGGEPPPMNRAARRANKR
jgi:DNA-binding YbaB/EbfC family protein